MKKVYLTIRFPVLYFAGKMINLRLRAKTKVNLKPELKLKVFWNTCDKELGGEGSLPLKITFFNSLLENLQKSVSFREIYVKYLE